MIFAPPWTFLQRLVFQLGVLDGRRGWLIAWLSANYIYIKYRKLGRLLAGEKLTHRSWPKSRRGLSVRPLIVDLGRDYRGGQHQALLLLQGLLARGHAPELIAIQDSLLARRAKDAGISVHGVPAGAGALPPLCKFAGWCAGKAWILFTRMSLTRSVRRGWREPIAPFP